MKKPGRSFGKVHFLPSVVETRDNFLKRFSAGVFLPVADSSIAGSSSSSRQESGEGGKQAKHTGKAWVMVHS